MCRKIASQYSKHQGCKKVLEIGPGMGALTHYLLEDEELEVQVMDIDTESIAYLEQHFPALENKIHEADFLRSDLKEYMGEEPFAVVGNFPYNISSQILFKCLDYRDQIPEIMGMFQKELAERVAEKPGTKTYGILSVLMQAYYDITYCFTVNENMFNPPPKVKSGVIRCVRNERTHLGCDEALFFKVVKQSFNQRRKTMRNSLRSILPESMMQDERLNLRPERMGVDDFIQLTADIQKNA